MRRGPFCFWCSGGACQVRAAGLVVAQHAAPLQRKPHPIGQPAGRCWRHAQRASVPEKCWSVRGRFRSGQGTYEKNNLPALLFGEVFFEGGHGFSAFADLIENFAVGAGIHAMGISETGGPRIVRGCVRPVAFSSLPVAVGAFIEIDGARGCQSRGRRVQRIFAELGGFGNFPGAVLIESDRDEHANQAEQNCEKNFAETERASRFGGHRQGEIFAHRLARQKKEKTLHREHRDTEDAEKKRKTEK